MPHLYILYDNLLKCMYAYIYTSMCIYAWGQT